ncbi:TIR domain-containing protein [Prevotella koreensis]|uniref:TIR domain-containing protein n=1 Tax=Prevotella koreensis TaxID=2490854 RepID=UPI0028E5FADA|nr:TIR domain-containing protein [Prevotella koreensis]
MRVFISWSGNKSHKVALVFRDWLPSVIQSIEPYVSSEDIDKGARWSTDIAKELENSTFGILCVTKDNLEAPWLSFEAGALSKTMDKAFVSPFLFDIKRSEVNGPILQFQSTIFQKEDLKKLVSTLNKACGENCIPESRLEKAFEVWFPTLEMELNKIRDVIDDPDEIKKKEEFNSHSSEILEEILDLARNNQKLLRNPDQKLYENIDDLRKLMQEQLMNMDRGFDMNTKRMSRKFSPMFMDEILHTPLVNSKKPFRLLVILSFFKIDFPWIYDLGKELLEVIKSEKNITAKKDALMEFKSIIEFTFEHPVMREIYGNSINMKEISYMLIEELERIYIFIKTNS